MNDRTESTTPADTNPADEITVTRPEGMYDEDWATLCRILTTGLDDIVAAIEKTGRR